MMPREQMQVRFHVVVIQDVATLLQEWGIIVIELDLLTNMGVCPWEEIQHVVKQREIFIEDE